MQLSTSRALIVVPQPVEIKKDYTISLISPYGRDYLSDCMASYVKGWLMFSYRNSPLFVSISKACLQGPKVLGKIAPSQEALDKLVWSRLQFNVSQTIEELEEIKQRSNFIKSLQAQINKAIGL